MAPPRSAALLALYTVVLGIVLLAPFDLPARNAARWRPAEPGMGFPSSGVVRSLEPPRRLHHDLTSGTGLALEVWLHTTHRRQTGPARIVSYSTDTSARNFTLGQSGSDLDVRLRTTETNLNGTPSLTVPDVFTGGAARHVVVTYDLQRLCAYIDGQPKACRSSPAGGLESWDPEHHLLLGNERTADRPWLGTLLLVALYGRSLSATEISASYRAAALSRPSRPAAEAGLVALWAFAEGAGTTVHDTSQADPVHLAIPGVLQEARCPFLSPGSRLSRVNAFALADVIANVLLFVPLGLLGYAALPRRWPITVALIATATITATFTIGVESLQYRLVSRCSQLEDVMLNCLGGFIGALVASGRLRRSPRQ